MMVFEILLVGVMVFLSWVYLAVGLWAIKRKLKEMDRESNKDAGAIKRRMTWSKKREKKDLKQEIER